MNRQQLWPAVEAEMKKAKRMHPSWPDHIAAKAGIVVEEAGELMRASLQLKYEKKGDGADQLKEIEKEAVQVIVTAIRFLESL